jgi:hypothetical protein
MGLTALTSLALSLMTGATLATSVTNTTPDVLAEVGHIKLEHSVASKEDRADLAPLKAWIEDLKEVESQNREEIKILDTNGRYSYGCLQFQEWTFRRYGEEYGLIDPDLDNVEDVIYDCKLQQKITMLMILDDHSNWKHWRNSVRKIGMPPRVSALISLK